ncbi:MAG: hypothetical protein ACD_72C00244G0005 [uncultured bacterium]|nr:MAG: hypothetical protein ACD_72C00244G0005 [uncultured bacterium]
MSNKLEIDKDKFKKIKKREKVSCDNQEQPHEKVMPPTVLMNLLGKIRDVYKTTILKRHQSKDFEKADEDTKKMQLELAEVAQKLGTREGVNFSKCQMDKVVDAYKKGKKVEFEAIGPYLSDYNMVTGEMWQEKLTKADMIGLAISKLLRSKFPKARLISLLDEYNTILPDSSDFYGKPTKLFDEKNNEISLPLLSISDEVKINFRNSLEQLFRQNGIIKEADKDGEDYLLVSESAKADVAQNLVEKLDKIGKIKRDGQKIDFVNPDAENIAYREINLRKSSGRWSCTALDAASYLDEKNLEITHLIILPNSYIEQKNGVIINESEEQQDEVWEILRTLGVKPTNYHNIFYDEDVPVEKVVKVIQDEIEKYF